MAYLYLAKQIGIAGAFALWAYLVAKGLFARTPLRLSFVQEVALLVPVGLGVAVLLLFGLGIAGHLTAPGIVASAGLGLALSCWRLRGRIAPAGAFGTIRAIASAATPACLAMIAIACTILVPVALRALTPPIASDEVRYHLPYALRHATVFRIGPGAEPPSASRQQGSGHPQRVPAHDAVAPRLPHLAAGEDDTRIISYFPAVSDGSARALVRIVNHSDGAGTVVIHGTDDAGATLGPVAFELEARQTRYFDSASLAACNLAQEMAGGLEESTRGGMRLSLIADFDIESMVYVRTEDGFVTSMHEVVGTTHNAEGDTTHEVPFFNPGSNRSQVSRLHLVNTGRRDIEVAVAGRDDAGVPAAEAVRVPLPAGAACRLGARGLESGDTGADDSTCEIVGGRLGNGQGRWRLSVTGAGGDLQVMSLLANPTGHLTNLSVSPGDGGEASTLPLVLPVPGSGRGPQGFVRVVNDSGEAGTVDILGLDDTGVSHGPITLALDEFEAVELDSLDLEAGNASKDLPEGLGNSEGYWRLKSATGLDVRASAYVRTGDGFVASLRGIARRVRDNEVDTYHVPYFDLGKKIRGNRSRITSSLRLIDSGHETVEVAIEGRDRTGRRAPEGVVSLVLPARQACKLSAKELETGEPDPGSGRCTGERFSFDGRFGEVTGPWSLSVTAAGGDIQVMSLMESPDGYLANLSAAGRRRSP